MYHAAALGYNDAVVRTPRRRHTCHYTASCPFNQVDCVPGHRIGDAQTYCQHKII